MLRVPLPYIMQYDVLCIMMFGQCSFYLGNLSCRFINYLDDTTIQPIWQPSHQAAVGQYLDIAQSSSCCRLVSFYPIWIQPSHQAAVGQYLFIQSGYSLAIKLLKLSISITNLVDQPSSCYKIVSFYQIWQPSHQATIGYYLLI